MIVLHLCSNTKRTEPTKQCLQQNDNLAIAGLDASENNLTVFCGRFFCLFQNAPPAVHQHLIRVFLSHKIDRPDLPEQPTRGRKSIIFSAFQWRFVSVPITYCSIDIYFFVFTISFIRVCLCKNTKLIGKRRNMGNWQSYKSSTRPQVAAHHWKRQLLLLVRIEFFLSRIKIKRCTLVSGQESTCYARQRVCIRDTIYMQAAHYLAFKELLYCIPSTTTTTTVNPVVYWNEVLRRVAACAALQHGGGRFVDFEVTVFR